MTTLNITTQSFLKSIKVLFPSLAFLLISCSEEPGQVDLPGIDFGTSEYYEGFLFSKSKNQSIHRTIKFDFNSWAKDNKADAQLILTDEDGKIIGDSGSGVELSINGEPSPDGRININSENPTDTLNITLLFSPSKNSRKLSGLIQLENGNIERINNIQTLGPDTNLFKWNAQQKVVMNPLLQGVYWATAILACSLLIWFLLLRNQIYPKMGNGRLTIETPYFKSFKTKGKRDITLTSQRRKQGGLNKIFTGNRVYEINPTWQEDLKFSPARRNQIRIKLPPGSSIAPYTSKLTLGQSYIIKKDDLEIKISYL